ncbi:HAD-IC family P-type ATPase [Candidatus Woesearchaeota archaeon]|nr:HAD-IC family P-type ATPase [Candidatus Woesearchaeota archaeon]
MTDNIWLKTEKDLFSELKTSRNGLSREEALNRLKKYGPNELKRQKKDTALKILLRQFKAFVVWVLVAASAISFIIGHMLEFTVISVIVGIIILISFFEEYKASKDMEALIKMTARQSTVIRDGKKIEIPSKEITIGDILVLERGDIVGADARLIESNSIKADESALTGESVSASKDTAALKGNVPLAQQANMVFSGTSITNGDGLAVVVRIGQSTEIGNISSMITSIKEEMTPLQKRLNKLTTQISIFAILLAILVFFIGMAHGQSWATMLVFSMAVIVSGIPESLPTVVAVTLASGMKGMAKKNAIVKRLPAVETLGTCTVICTDKTGTLTQNKMVVENIYTTDVELTVTGEGYSPEGLFMRDQEKIDATKHKTVSKILEIGLLCNNADLEKKDEAWNINGEATEGALIVLASKAGMVKEEYHSRFPRAKEHPFDPDRKCMSTVHTYKGKNIAYSKGAPESVLKRSGYYLHNGTEKKLTEAVKKQFLQKNMEYASKGLRVLSLAYKEHKGSMEIDNVEKNLVFVGLVSIRDPPAPGVKEAVARCKSAGIRVVMITGDNEVTAKAIAAELGIFSEYNYAVTGSELDNLDEAGLIKIIDRTTVYARITHSPDTAESRQHRRNDRRWSQ